MYDDLTCTIKEKVLIMQLVEMIEIPKDKEVVIRYLSGQQSNEMGKEWSVTRQCIEQRLRRAIQDIKEKVNANGRRLHSGRRILQDRNAKDRLDSPISC
jgi:DNA-directed RNA polymerase specialized sigma24 family protein